MSSKSAAKKQPTEAAATSAPSAAKKNDPFAGYKQAEEMVQPDGYWLPEAGALHGVLVSAFEYKQKSGRSKGKDRVVYIFKLLSPTIASVKPASGSGRDTAQLEPGELCAVFGTHGLRMLNELSGCSIALKRLPEKKVLANGNEMWEYKCLYKGERKPLVIRKALTTASEPDYGDADDSSGGDASFNPDEFF